MKDTVSLDHPSGGSFSIRNYRVQWVSDLSTSCAFEIETLALAWYVLVETESALLMAAVAALQYLGTLISPLLGVAGDRMGQRNAMRAMRAYYTVVALGVLAASVAGLLMPWLALAAATVSGLVRPSDIGMRNVVTSIIVPSRLLLPAVGLSRITVDLARIAGALAGAALMATLGMSWAYVIVVAFYAAATALMSLMRMEDRVRNRAAQSVLAQLVQAVRSVRGAPAQTATMGLAFLVNFSAFPFVTGLLPYVAKEKFQMDELGLGLLIAVAAGGCVTASLLLARLRIARPAITMLKFSIAWHVLILLFAVVDFLPLALVLLFLAGMAQSLCMIPMAAFLLGNVDPAVRGGVMGLRSMAVYGLPLGLMATGYILNAGWDFGVVAAVFCVLGVGVTVAIWMGYRTHLSGRPAQPGGGTNPASR